MACQYANMFGKPTTGAHAYRIANIAVVDVAATVVLAWFVAYVMKWSFGWTLVGCFTLGIAAHRFFCVRTTVDRMLFKQ